MLKDVDPVLVLLLIGIVFYTGVLIYVQHMWKDDGQMFQEISSILAGFTGAFLGRMIPKEKGGGGDK